jgi:hypothetical protein
MSFSTDLGVDQPRRTSMYAEIGLEYCGETGYLCGGECKVLSRPNTRLVDKRVTIDSGTATSRTRIRH